MVVTGCVVSPTVFTVKPFWVRWAVVCPVSQSA